MATIATVAMSGGAAIGALAVALYVTAPKDTPAKVAFSPSAGGGSVEMTWRW